MTYTITITKQESKTEMKQGSYHILSWEYLPQSAYDDLPFEERKKWKSEDGQYCKPNYGYGPQQEVTTEVSKKVFEQTVEELDISAVIVAVNALGEQK